MKQISSVSLLASLVEGVKTVLLVALVERVVDDSAYTTSTHLLEGSIRSTTSACNEGNDTDNDTSDDTGSEGGSDNDNGRNNAFPGHLDTLTLLFLALSSTAVLGVRAISGIAVQRLSIAALESYTDFDSTEEAVGSTWQVLRTATLRSAEVALARVLEVAKSGVGGVDAVTSLRIAHVGGASNAVVALSLRSLASTGLVVANGGNAHVGRVASNSSVRAHAIRASINSASIAIVAIQRGRLATEHGVATGNEASIWNRGSAVSVDRLAVIISTGGASAVVSSTSIITGGAINGA
jgi:hypothetical protein